MNTTELRLPQSKHYTNFMASKIQIQRQMHIQMQSCLWGTAEARANCHLSIWLEVNKGHQEEGPLAFFPPSFFSVKRSYSRCMIFHSLRYLEDRGSPQLMTCPPLHKWEHHPATQAQALYTPAVSSGSWVHCYPSPAVSSVLSVADCEQRFPSEPESGHCMLEL